MRKSTLFLGFICLNVMVLGGLLVLHPLSSKTQNIEGIEKQARLVRKLELTDICLFTEARYTRHLSQADIYSAFQDHPGCLEHFPSGSLTRPPVSAWIFKPGPPEEGTGSSSTHEMD